MISRAALQDIRTFFARGETTASDPKATSPEASDFSPVRKVVLAGLIALTALTAVAPTMAHAADAGAGRPAAVATVNNTAVEGFVVGHGVRENVVMPFNAPTKDICLQKGANLAWAARTNSVSIVCVDARTGESLANLTMERGRMSDPFQYRLVEHETAAFQIQNVVK